MDGVMWVVVIAAIAVAVLALRRSSRLAKDADRLKREHYYAESKFKRLFEEMRETVESLRLHLAAVAEGRQVSRELILGGRLYRDVSTEELRQALDETGPPSDRVVVVDVRTPKEYAAQRIPGARLVPLEELEARYEADIPRTAEKVFVYCMGGERSRSACEFLARRGYTNLSNVTEGLHGWRGQTDGEGHVTLVQIEPLRKAASTV